MSARRSHVRKLIVAAVAASAIAATGLAVQQTAMAGTNGQQISFCSLNKVDYVTTVDVTGKNQDGTFITEGGWDVRRKNGALCERPSDHWWVGNVEITWHYIGYPDVTTTCNIPKVQPDGYSGIDQWLCYDETTA